MADKPKKPDAPAPAPASGGDDGEKKRGNLPLVIGIIAGIMLIQAVAAYFLVPKPVDEDAKVRKAEEDSLRLISERATSMGAVVEAPIEVVVNIAGTDGERFLKAAILLEYDEKNVQLGNELLKRGPKYKDLLLDHLSSLSLMELTEPGARDKIRKDLLRMINATLPPKLGEVQNVMFATFIIQ